MVLFNLGHPVCVHSAVRVMHAIVVAVCVSTLVFVCLSIATTDGY